MRDTVIKVAITRARREVGEREREEERERVRESERERKKKV